MRSLRESGRWWPGVLAAAVVYFGLLAAPAHALTVTASPDVTATVSVTVTLDAGETSGTVLLVRDGVVIAETPDVTGTVVFEDVPLTVGPHRFRATLRSAGRFVSSRPWITVYSWGTPAAPRWISPTGGYAASPVSVRLYAGASTSSMTLNVNGARIKTIACVPGQLVDLGKVAIGSGSSTFEVLCESRFGDVAAYSTKATRVSYPWPTCIIVDKSDFKLYWIRDNQLVKTYPIAHGKGNCTPLGIWKILAKYKTDPRGVYGPRKMRLFRRSGSAGHYTYSYTAYGIHGTNQPWVIGTMASHGCIRMYNRDVLELWPQVPIGTMVITRQ